MFDDNAVEGCDITPRRALERLIPSRLLQRRGGDCYRVDATARRRRDADEATAGGRRLIVRTGVGVPLANAGVCVWARPAYPMGDIASAR
jgi:hypothetical protein